MRAFYRKQNLILKKERFWGSNCILPKQQQAVISSPPMHAKSIVYLQRGRNPHPIICWGSPIYDYFIIRQCYTLESKWGLNPIYFSELFDCIAILKIGRGSATNRNTTDVARHSSS